MRAAPGIPGILRVGRAWKPYAYSGRSPCAHTHASQSSPSHLAVGHARREVRPRVEFELGERLPQLAVEGLHRHAAGRHEHELGVVGRPGRLLQRAPHLDAVVSDDCGWGGRGGWGGRVGGRLGGGQSRRVAAQAALRRGVQVVGGGGGPPRGPGHRHTRHSSGGRGAGGAARSSPCFCTARLTVRKVVRVEFVQHDRHGAGGEGGLREVGPRLHQRGGPRLDARHQDVGPAEEGGSGGGGVRRRGGRVCARARARSRKEHGWRCVRGRALGARGARSGSAPPGAWPGAGDGAQRARSKHTACR